MSRGVAFRRAVKQEFEDAASWYEARQPGLGLEFVDAVRDGLRLAAENPTQYAMMHGDLRCVRVRRFPYLILFRAEANRIVVIAIFHARRNPIVWKSRD